MPRALPIVQPFSSLDEVRVASPCPASWADMVGSDKVRFCASCQKNVYNLSGMTRADALALVQSAEGRMCIRMFRRADGTILTEDCPVGLAAVLRRARRTAVAACATSLAAVATLLAFVGGAAAKPACRRFERVQQNVQALVDERARQGEAMAGEMAMPPYTAPAVDASLVPSVEIKGKMALPRDVNAAVRPDGVK